MRGRGVNLQYTFGERDQRGSQVSNPLFDLLFALHQHGSIQAAAQALGASYRHVWGQLKHWEAALGEPLVTWSQGQPARLTPFAERLHWAETRARTRLTPHIEALRLELERVLEEALVGTQEVLTVWASHDQALPLLQQVASRRQLHVELRFAGSMDALRALAEGRCTVAGFHVPALAHGRSVFARSLKPLLKPGRHKLMGCLRRVQGLMLPAGNPSRVISLHDIADGRLRFVNRQPGAGTRLLMTHLLQEAGLSPSQIMGFDDTAEDSHVAVAAAVAAGSADVGLGIEAAARHFGLAFVPMVAEDYFLVCLKDVLDRPAVRALRETLSDPVWSEILEQQAGYEVTPQAGQVLALTQALPWWRFRSPSSPRTVAP